MSRLREFERRVVTALAKGSLPDEVLARVLVSEYVAVEQSGVGYFVTLRDPSLPKERLVCSEPRIVAKVGDVKVGFVVFIEHHEFTLECHSWDGEPVPADVRDREIEIEIETGT